MIITHRLLRIDGGRHHLCLVAHLCLAVKLCSFRFKGSWSLSLAVCSWVLGSQALAVSLSVLLNTRESISDLCFTAAAVPRSVRDESPDTPPSQRASLVASPSSSESVTRCSALRLLLRGEYCLAASPPHSDLSSSSKLVAPSLTQAIGCRRGAVSRWLQIGTRRTSPSALLKTCVLLKAHSNPSLCMVELSRHVGYVGLTSTSPANYLASIL